MSNVKACLLLRESPGFFWKPKAFRRIATIIMELGNWGGSNLLSSLPVKTAPKNSVPTHKVFFKWPPPPKRTRKVVGFPVGFPFKPAKHLVPSLTPSSGGHGGPAVRQVRHHRLAAQRVRAPRLGLGPRGDHPPKPVFAPRGPKGEGGVPYSVCNIDLHIINHMSI